MDETYDAIVVGGRVAFPRSTISTHFFRGGGLVAVLDRRGLLDRDLSVLG